MSGEYIDPSEMVAKLIAAGWQKINRHLWRSPEGEYFRGPFAAWEKLQKGGKTN